MDILMKKWLLSIFLKLHWLLTIFIDMELSTGEFFFLSNKYLVAWVFYFFTLTHNHRCFIVAASTDTSFARAPESSFCTCALQQCCETMAKIKSVRVCWAHKHSFPLPALSQSIAGLAVMVQEPSGYCTGGLAWRTKGHWLPWCSPRVRVLFAFSNATENTHENSCWRFACHL